MNDQIPLSKVNLISAPDIYAWPATAEISRIALGPEGLAVDFTRRQGAGAWPPLPSGEGGRRVQFTAWIVLNIASSWWAAPVLPFGPDDQVAGASWASAATAWFGDRTKYTPLAGNQPKAGDLVGLLVTPGDARLNSVATGRHERSNLVTFNWPDEPGEFTWAVEEAPAPAVELPPAPAPAPEPPPAPSPASIPEAWDPWTRVFLTAAALEGLLAGRAPGSPLEPDHYATTAMSFVDALIERLRA